MQIISGRKFDEERALYGSRGIRLENCAFDGPADGESALKECSDVEADGCFFNLRYPMWHVKGLRVSSSRMTELCRAALWYSEDVSIAGTSLHGIKALRECRNAGIRSCDIASPEFGWFSRGVTMEDTRAESEYFMLQASDIHFKNVDFRGKYSFQYVKNAVFDHCVFDTKDAFWHGENILVRDSVVKGEYLGWYSDGLTLENCRITGTQPLCYCRNLRLVNCSMEQTDLCFEKSDVEAVITTPVLSIRNPRSGHIRVPAAGGIIRDDPLSEGEVTLG